MRGAVGSALRRTLAALVLFGCVVATVAVLSAREWWAIPVAIAVGLFGLVLSALIYRLRAGWSLPFAGRWRRSLGAPGSRPPLA